MPSVVGYLNCSQVGYRPGYIVTVHIDPDEILSDFGYEYHNFDVITGNVGDPPLQTTEGTSLFVHTENIDDSLGIYIVRFEFYTLQDGVPTYTYYTSSNWNPAAIWLTIRYNKTLVCQVNQGGLVPIPIYPVILGGQAMVWQTPSGPVVSGLPPVGSGDPVAAVRLAGGGQAVVPLSGEVQMTSATLNLTASTSNNVTFHFWVKSATTNWTDYVLINITSGTEYFQWMATGDIADWTEITLGEFTSPTFVSITIYASPMLQSPVYIDHFHWSDDYADTNWGFEAQGGDHDWTLMGRCEITTAEYYEGSHCLKLY